MSVIKTDIDGRAEIVELGSDAGKRSRARALADTVKGRTAGAGQAVRQRAVSAGQAAKQRPAVPAAGVLAVVGGILAVVLRRRQAAKSRPAMSGRRLGLRRR